MTSTSFYSATNVPARSSAGAVDVSRMELELCRNIDDSTETIWHQFRNNNPLLQSGYFHPDFYRAVEQVRDDVEHAVLRTGTAVAAILPFQRVGRRVANPVGGMMNDFHGLLSDSAIVPDYQWLLAKANLSRFDFHAWVDQPVREPVRGKDVFDSVDSPFVDLSQGLFQYREWLHQHSSTVHRQAQKRRAMERALGPLRLEMDVRDPSILEQVIHWKQQRFARSRTFDLFTVEWTANLVREIFQVHHDSFRGQLSGLWAGDTLVAAHFGFVCGSTLHYWFPAHNHEHRRFSPGTQLLYDVLGACPDEGIDRVDLSYGESDLKTRFANNGTQVQIGCFGQSEFAKKLEHQRYRWRQMLKNTPLKETIKRVFRPLHPNFGQGRFR